jgi:hypothetical protein
MLSVLANKKYISEVDALSSFYQWRVRRFPQRQEVFNVAVMGL